MTHTPTPWEFRDDSTKETPAFFSISSTPKGGWGGGCIGYLSLRKTETGSNARRIVACVNALEGFDTAAIEAGVVKELVEALEATKNWLADKRWGTWHYMDGTAVYSDKQQIDEKINIALAKIGGAL